MRHSFFLGVSEGGNQRFNFALVSSIFNITVDTTSTMTVTVTAKVFYAGGKKRYITQSFFLKRTEDGLDDEQENGINLEHYIFTS